MDGPWGRACGRSARLPVVGGAFVLAALVADDVALVGELGAVEAFEQEAHAVAFQPEGEFQLVAGDRLEVVGAVEVGGAVDVGRAGALEVFEVGFFAYMLGALEHHVLEEVGEAGASGALVDRPDVVPEVDGDEGEAMVFVGEDDEAVGQFVLFVLIRDLQGLAAGRVSAALAARCEGKAEQQRGGGGQQLVTTRVHSFFSTEAGKGLEECLRTRTGSGCEDDTNWGRRWPEWRDWRACVGRADLYTSIMRTFAFVVVLQGRRVGQSFGCECSDRCSGCVGFVSRGAVGEGAGWAAVVLLSNDPSEEPRMQIDDTPKSQMVFGVTVDGWKPGQSVKVDDSAAGYPVRKFERGAGRGLYRAGGAGCVRDVSSRRMGRR